MKFYRCEHCKNIIMKLNDSGVPVVSVEGNAVTVKVGEVEHPMMEEHFIQFIVLETSNGFQTKYLKPGEKPEAVFVLADGEKAVAAYEYCNLHGLWVKEI